MTELDKLIAKEKAKHDLNALELCVTMNNVSKDVREKAAKQLAAKDAALQSQKEFMENWGLTNGRETGPLYTGLCSAVNS